MKRQDTYVRQDAETIARHCIKIVDERLSQWEEDFPDENSELTCSRLEYLALCEIAERYLIAQEQGQK